VAAAGLELVAHITVDRYDDLYAIASTAPATTETQGDDTPDVSHADAQILEDAPDAERSDEQKREDLLLAVQERLSEIPEYEVRYCIAAQQGNDALISRIDEGIAILRSTGRLDEIYRKWFGFVRPVGYTTQEILMAVAVGLSLALAIAVWAIFRQRKLRKHISAQARSLQASETNYRTLLESASDGIWVSDSAGRVLDANPAVTRMFGYEPDEILSMNIAQVVVESEVAQLIPRMAKLRVGENARGEWQCQRKDGSTFPVEVSATILPDGRLLGILRDVSERKAADEALRFSEAQLSNALKIANLGHWEYDVASDTFTFNDHFYDLMRTTAEREGGYKMSPRDYAGKFCHPDDIPIVAEEVANAIAATDPAFTRRIEHRVIFGDGKPGHVAVRILIQKDSTGRTVRSYGVNQDITHLKLADEALRSAERRFRALIEHSADGRNNISCTSISWAQNKAQINWCLVGLPCNEGMLVVQLQKIRHFW
jgi:PAS domain S-box-containing protein